MYLVGSFVLVSLAGCGRGFFQAEREPWRAEAEVACLKSGAVKESVDIVRISPISGPGACGADYPLKVSALGEPDGSFGFADEDDPRPPASIGNQPRWPTTQPQSGYPQQTTYPQPSYPQQGTYPPPAGQNPSYQNPSYNSAPVGPTSLTPPGVARPGGEINLPADGADAAGSGRYGNAPSYPAPPPNYSSPAPYYGRPAEQPLPRLGPGRGNPAPETGPVAMKPAATLACPIVSALDRWLADTVQPAAMRWFGSRVVEIKQMSSYSCRGMNGHSYEHISEHAFGNALDIAAFAFADGRRITVKNGWHGLPEEQGFLRDVQAGACQQFTTVLAPGSNAYHYDHIHLDLMRRASRRVICKPAAVSGEEIAARGQRNNPYASRDPNVTGSLGSKKTRQGAEQGSGAVNEEDELLDD